MPQPVLCILIYFTKFVFEITAGISEEDIEYLQSMENIDPEVKPGLFQGDMALNNEVRTAVHISNM